jgi:hypothetical protein
MVAYFFEGLKRAITRIAPTIRTVAMDLGKITPLIILRMGV